MCFCQLGNLKVREVSLPDVPGIVGPQRQARGLPRMTIYYLLGKTLGQFKDATEMEIKSYNIIYIYTYISPANMYIWSRACFLRPNPWSDGGLGFLEWTGIWAALLTVVLAIGAGGSWFIARLQLEPAVASQLRASQAFTLHEMLSNRHF